MPRWGQWPTYVPVAERLARARRELARLGVEPSPVRVAGRAIARTFWGKAWCENLERYGDYANRLPRGRTYLRNGSVLDLRVEAGQVRSRVAGGELYSVEVEIAGLAAPRWAAVKKACTGKIASLVGLLRGELSSDVLEVIVRPGAGLFPEPKEIHLSCSCPDAAYLCKHLAATLYGVGARLDERPELFFLLRKVDQAELIAAATADTVVARPGRARKTIAADKLSSVFGIELDEGPKKRRR